MLLLLLLFFLPQVVKIPRVIIIIIIKDIYIAQVCKGHKCAFSPFDSMHEGVF